MKVGADDMTTALGAVAAETFAELPRFDPLLRLAPDALHGLAGRVVSAIDPHTEADPVGVLMTFLVAVGNLLGPGPHALAGEDQHPGRLSAVLVGRSSKARKGMSRGGPRRLLAAVDREWAKTRIASGLSSGEGLIYHVRDAREERQPIKDKGRVTGYEPVIVDPGIDDKRLLVEESELAAVLKRMERESNSLSAVMRQAWDSGNLATLTKNSPLRATGAHISVLGHITADELKLYLAANEQMNGWANRLMFFLVTRSKILPSPRALTPDTLAPLATELEQIVETASHIELLERDPEAESDWTRIYPSLSEDRPGLVGAVTARAEAHVLRLSVLYSLLDGSAFIGRPHLRAALAVWQYAEASARAIFGDRLGDPIADTIESALLDRGPLSRTQIRDLFHHNVSSARISAALALLAIQGRAHFRMVRGETGGRPVEIWEATKHE